MSLLNATLACLGDQDSYYDVVDSLEEQGMERVIQHYMSKQGIENDLLKQMHIYEAVLKFTDEDGDLDENVESLDHNVKNMINRKDRNSNRNYLNSIKNGNAIERRRSKRHALNCSLIKQNTKKKVLIDFLPSWQKSVNQTTEQFSKRSLLNLSKIEKDLQNSTKMNGQTNGHSSPNELNEQFDELTPGLRKRLNLRDLNKESSSPTPQQTKPNIDNYNLKNQRSSIASCSSLSSNISSTSSNNSSSSGAYSLGSQEEANNKDLDSQTTLTNNNLDNEQIPNTFAEKKSWMLSMMYGKSEDKKDEEIKNGQLNKTPNSANKLTKNWQPMTTTAIIGTKEEISGSSIGVKNIKDRIMNGDDQQVKKVIPNYLRNVKQDNLLTKETEYLHWEQLKNSLSRPLLINDLDFTDLVLDDDNDIFQLSMFNNNIDKTTNGIPGPPPLPISAGKFPPPPPPMPLNGVSTTDGTSPANKINSPFSLSKTSLSSNLSTVSNSSNCNSNYSSYSSTFGSLRSNLSTSSSKNSSIDSSYNSMKNGSDKLDTLKSKKTLKLFWKEVKEDKGLLSRLKRKKTIWDEVENVQVDTAKLEHLFENRTKELSNKVRTFF